MLMTSCAAACRDIVPLGASRSNFHYSVDQKRVLNMENVVNDADNIKQVGWHGARLTCLHCGHS